MMRAPAKIIVILAAITVITTGVMALAGALIVNKINIGGSFISNPLLIEPGENAGGTDISGTVIVQIANSRVNITIHPTYQITMYPSVLNVTNNGNTTLYLSVVVSTPVSAPGVRSHVYLALFDRVNSTLIIIANLSAQDTYGPIPLEAGAKQELGLITVYPEGQPLTTLQGSFYLVASSVNETGINPG